VPYFVKYHHYCSAPSGSSPARGANDPEVRILHFGVFVAGTHLVLGCLSHTKPFNIPHGRLTEEPAILAAEL
jgi:hypothetical protein